ncbi:MAG: hypothetical protein DMG60_01740 [Acidobacteria bacterium]|nr:MAG: hypothetical protein DMG60_01740 [Acidobacteriota bacterium]
MTRNERKHVAELLRTTEYLLLENLALKLLLEHRQVPGWRKLLDKLLADKEMVAGVHLRFKDIYREIELSDSPSSALHTLVSGIALRKPH